MHTQKIATCCYCGTRTVLQLTARSGHELACASCGAPIHEMKPLRMDRKKSDRNRAATANRPSGNHVARGRKSRKKGGFWRVLEEVADVVEDILD